MRKRLIGVVALGAATLFLGVVPAHAATAIASTGTATYVEWSAPTYVEWFAPTYVEW